MLARYIVMWFWGAALASVWWFSLTIVPSTDFVTFSVVATIFTGVAFGFCCSVHWGDK